MENLRATLKDRPDYAAALAEKEKATQDAAAFHEQGDTGAGDISTIALRRLEASKTLSQIDREAAARDPDVVKAKARLNAALQAQGSAAKASAN